MNNIFANGQSSLKYTFNGQVFFYCLPVGYQPLSICIAEGLKQLGIPFYSNVNYLQIDAEREDYLFSHSPSVTPDDCAAVVVEKGWILRHQNLPENLFHPKRNYITVYLDDADGPITPAWTEPFRNFDFIFRTHCNNRSEYPANFVPWVFGLSNRVLRETSDLPNFERRSRHLLVNFRVLQDTMTNKQGSQEQLPRGLVRIDPIHVRVENPLRQIIRDRFCPLTEKILPINDTVEEFEQPPSDSYHYLQWQQTGQRHYPNYYQRLKTAAACAAVGGYVVPGTESAEPYAEWWDSWRFWESLAAGCVTFHVDFEKYGIVLPVMPENWRHYIGIDLDNIESAVSRIASNPEILAMISREGRLWAIENYGPVPTALRFLETISADKLFSNSIAVTPMDINLIVFPDWSQREEVIGLELEQAIRAIASYPDKSSMALLIATDNISDEEAHLILSAVTLNLLMQEDLDLTEGPEVSIIGDFTEIQWSDILPQLHARLVLEKENRNAIAYSGAETLPAYELERFKEQPTGQLFFGLGHKCFREGRWKEAIEQYQKVLEIQTGNAELYWHLSECYRQLSLSEQFFSTLQEGIQLYPAEGSLHFALIVHLQRSGRTQDAIASAKAASEVLPNDYTFQILKNLLVPTIYDNPDEINFYRQHYIKGLKSLIQHTSLETPEEQKYALAGIGRLTNFYLSYQAQNDVELQRQYGNLIHKIMAANYPQWVAPLSIPPVQENNKIRIGYASAYLHSYSGTLWLTGWLRYCDKQSFEIYCYYTGNQPDPITQKFQGYSDVFHHIPYNLEAACEQIIADQLHILVFPEIGMDPQIMQMAALRLAPVQCVAWGHPVTSGLPTIDYFLSSELMEPENAQDHYSETLIRLPNIGVSYPKTYIPSLIKKRSDFHLRDEAAIYLCCQAPFKYLPQYDFIFAEIARRVPQAQFVFLRGSILQVRLNRAFAAVGLKSEDYCVFLTIPERFDYLTINMLSDVYLDTFCWSGGNTTLEAIACNLPVVTCPGKFMRGRHSYSFLKMLGVTDTIAKNEEEYIEIAVKLGLDPAWRHNIVERMNESHDRLFDDKVCVAGLEVFYKQVVRERLHTNSLKSR